MKRGVDMSNKDLGFSTYYDANPTQLTTDKKSYKLWRTNIKITIYSIIFIIFAVLKRKAMTILIPNIHGRAFWHDAIPFFAVVR